MCEEKLYATKEDYYAVHTCCPECGSDKWATLLWHKVPTYVCCTFHKGKPFKDTNRITCDCGWEGIRHDLKPKPIPYNELIAYIEALRHDKGIETIDELLDDVRNVYKERPDEPTEEENALYTALQGVITWMSREFKYDTVEDFPERYRPHVQAHRDYFVAQINRSMRNPVKLTEVARAFGVIPSLSDYDSEPDSADSTTMPVELLRRTFAPYNEVPPIGKKVHSTDYDWVMRDPDYRYYVVNEAEVADYLRETCKDTYDDLMRAFSIHTAQHRTLLRYQYPAVLPDREGFALVSPKERKMLWSHLVDKKKD